MKPVLVELTNTPKEKTNTSVLKKVQIIPGFPEIFYLIPDHSNQLSSGRTESHIDSFLSEMRLSLWSLPEQKNSDSTLDYDKGHTGQASVEVIEGVAPVDGAIALLVLPERNSGIEWENYRILHCWKSHLT